MFHPSLGNKAPYPSLRQAAQETFGLVIHTIERCQGAGTVRAGEALHRAMLAWSTVHGFASLAVDDQLEENGLKEDPTTLAVRMTDEMFQGLAPR
jgi:hypothetical protein